MILILRTETFAKMFVIVSITGLISYVVITFNSLNNAFRFIKHKEKYQVSLKNDLKYILYWVTSKNMPNPGEGQQSFIQNNCSFINCFITTNKEIVIEDYKNFDAIIFNMTLLQNWRKENLPQRRSSNQKYIFHSMLPSNDYPICTKGLDNYFNWTWSYKLYSDIITPFIEVKHLDGKVIAPSTNVDWPTPDSEDTNRIIEANSSKSKAVVIVISDCKPFMTRMSFSKELQYYLNEHNLIMDIYGCGGTECPNKSCIKNIQEYYFYLVYEDSFSEDYLTQEVLKAYDNNAVPILKSGIDYSKFLPPGSYIDATTTYPDKLAAVIEYIIRNPSTYSNYHLWRKYYTITKVNVNRGFCDLCELLNNKVRVELHNTYETFRKWWYYGELSERCYPKGAENFFEVFSYFNSTVKRN